MDVAESVEITEDDVFQEYAERYSDDENSDIDGNLDNTEDINDSSEINEISTIMNNLGDVVSPEDIDNLTLAISDILKKIIAPWAVECNIPHIPLSKLLYSLKNEISVLSLPLDPQTY